MLDLGGSTLFTIGCLLGEMTGLETGFETGFGTGYITGGFLVGDCGPGSEVGCKVAGG